MSRFVREACSCGGQVEGPPDFVLVWRVSHRCPLRDQVESPGVPRTVGFTLSEQVTDTVILGE